MLSTSTMLLLLGISAFQVAGGCAVGYWLRSRRRSVSQTSDVLTARLTDALKQLQTLADDIGTEAVGHAEQVKAVAQSLSNAAEADVDKLHQALIEGMTQIATANSRLQSQLTDVETRLEEQSQQLETQLADSRLDALTSVSNRRAFEEELTRRLAEWRRRPAPISILLVDIDHFKKINQARGEAVGDAVLRDVARVLQAVLREMDFLARYGGEEFAVILPATTLRDARRAAQRSLEAVANHNFEYDHESVEVTISLGLAEVVPGDDVETIVRRADEALYLSKAAGRNCGHFHSGTDFLSLDSPRLIEHAQDAGLASAALSTAAGANLHEHDEPDPMTLLPTAAAFAHELRRRVQRCRAESRAMSLVLIDVDRLTQINGQEGRTAGDLVLRRTAEILRKHCRPGDYAARYHQGQFALLLDGSSVDDGIRTAELIRAAVREGAGDSVQKPIDATVSCGIAEVASNDRSVSVVMRAGIALAAAKSSGRDCTFVHDGQAAEPADGTFSA